MDRKRIMTTYCLLGLLVIAAAGLAYIKIASIPETDSKTDIVMEYDSKWNPERLSDLYGQMLSNYEAGETWKNIPAAKEILYIMKEVAPERDEEINPAMRMLICERIVDNDLIDLRDTPRLYLEYLEYWKMCERMNKTEEELADLDLDTEFKERADEMSRKITLMLSGKKEAVVIWNSLGHLKHDPVQLTPQWEEHVYEIEKECDERLKDEPRHMGFCHAYWSTKRAVAANYGIEWRSPSSMNPGVMFD